MSPTTSGVAFPLRRLDIFGGDFDFRNTNAATDRKSSELSDSIFLHKVHGNAIGDFAALRTNTANFQMCAA
jgi:hypothetical protein